MITEQAISNVWRDIWCMQKNIRIGKNCAVTTKVLEINNLLAKFELGILWNLSLQKKTEYVKIFGQKMRADDVDFPNFTFFQNFEPFWTFDDPMTF